MLWRYLAFALLACSAVVAQTSSELFGQAEAAFEQEDYARALERFESARAAGMAGPALAYNIAVCLYRLERWSESEREFARLAERYPGMRTPLSHPVARRIRRSVAASACNEGWLPYGPKTR